MPYIEGRRISWGYPLPCKIENKKAPLYIYIRHRALGTRVVCPNALDFPQSSGGSVNWLFLRDRTPPCPFCSRTLAWLLRDWFERLEVIQNRRRFDTKLVSILEQFWDPCWDRFCIKIIILDNFSVYRFYIGFVSVFGSIFQQFLHVFWCIFGHACGCCCNSPNFHGCTFCLGKT